MRDQEINIAKVVNYLNHAFSKAGSSAIQRLRQRKDIKGKNGSFNSRGSLLYKYQVEYCYLINEIQAGPRYFAPKKIQLANELIERLNTEQVAK